MGFVKVLVAQSCPTLLDPMYCRLPGSSVYGILQAKYWNGLPFPYPGNLPNPGMEPSSPALQADSVPSEPPGKPIAQALNDAKFGSRNGETLEVK